MTRISRKKMLQRDLFHLYVSNYASGNDQEAEDLLILREAIKEERDSEARVGVPKSDWNRFVLPLLSSDY